MALFSKTFEVGWANVDPNMHLKQTAYIEFTDNVRVAFFEAHGLPFLKLIKKMHVGPVVFRLMADYKREVLLGETITVNTRLAHLSEDERKWKFSHEIIKADGEIACIVTVEGAWMDLKARKITPPPPEITEIIKKMN